jgi:filamentous hemagglutinin
LLISAPKNEKGGAIVFQLLQSCNRRTEANPPRVSLRPLERERGAIGRACFCYHSAHPEAMSCSSLRLSPNKGRPVLRSFLYLVVCLLNFELSLTSQAGDILRGGAVFGKSRGRAPETGNPTAAAVQAGAVPGKDMLARTTQALHAVQAMQAAARATAAANTVSNLNVHLARPAQPLPSVPNGLVTNGLVPDSGLASQGVANAVTTWQNAQTPTQTTSGGTTNVSIVQTAQQAVLNWQTFNVGTGTHVTFDQTAGGANASQWIAFNKINDPSGLPSQILGSLDAIGQLYVINANGIIFGGSSQINTHTLVASALPINDNLIARGLLNNPDNQFLFSALPIPAGTNGTPAFTPPPANTPDGDYGDVTVEAGAQITSPTSADHVGGRVALIGANVENDGTITTPDGQTILAAGLQVGMAAHSSSDPSLRGLDVYVGQVGSYAGTTINNGLIEAPRADVTMIGKEVDQLGFIDSSTSVSLNGRIDLLADYNALSGDPKNTQASALPFLFQSSGLVTLGPNSVTQILPELSSAERIVGTELALPSQINIQGLAIHEAQNAIILAPSANISMEAGIWVPFLSGGFPTSQLVFSNGQIYIDDGAVVDVSGSQDVSASVAENVIPVQLLGTELANSPLQRDGPLYDQTVYVDITQTGTYNGAGWIGSPIGDLSGYANLVQRTVGELTTNGGTINLSAGGSVVVNPSATIDVSGGSIAYQGAVVPTTQVIDSSGHIYDISQATPDRVYTGIVNGFADTHPRWGVVNTFQTPLGTSGQFEAGYVQGGNGGSLSISAPAMALDGSLLGATVSGVRQRAGLPTAASLSLSFVGQSPIGPPFLPTSPTPPDILFSSTMSQTPADPFALDSMGDPLPPRADRTETFVFAPQIINQDGFGNVAIDNGDGNVEIPADVSLDFGPHGSFDVTAANMSIGGSLVAPSGMFAFNVLNISPELATELYQTQGAQTPPPSPDRGLFSLSAGAILDVSGLLVDDRQLSPTAGSMPITTAGGSIAIDTYTAALAEGSQIDVSGGAYISGTGAVSYGKGGSLSIRTGQDLNIPSVLGGQIHLGVTLRGFSGAVGASLSLAATKIQVGGTAPDDATLTLSPSFFDQGGFASFNLTGIGRPTGTFDVFEPAVVIAPGVTLAPVVKSLVATPLASGQIDLKTMVLDEGIRSPASLSFNAPGIVDPFSKLLAVRGAFVSSDGSQVKTDAGGSISVAANTADIGGSLIAPGGAITVRGAGSFPNFDTDPQFALTTVHLGSNSVLSAAGKTVIVPNALGQRIGTVFAGGNITISGNIVADAGSLLDVSGTTGVLDLVRGAVGVPLSNRPMSTIPLIPTRVDSNGGSISLIGSQELFTDATLRAFAGGPSATGGSLSVTSGRFYSSEQIPDPRDVNLVVTQDGLTIPAGGGGIGQKVLDTNGSVIPGRGYFAADSFENGGFDSLTLGGVVQFAGPVSIDANSSLSVASGGVIFADSAVNLTAAYVALGLLNQAPLAPDQQLFYFTKLVPGLGDLPFYFEPTYGSGSLAVTADLIDIGVLSLQGIGDVNFVSNDLRGNGVLNVAGDIRIQAGQIYPPTDLSFTISAFDYTSASGMQPGTVTIVGSGQRPLPFSAAGILNIYASEIFQGGTLRAPFGQINLGWDGQGNAPVNPLTNMAVPVSELITLAPGSETSVSAIDPTTGKPLVLPYGLNYNGVAWIDPSGFDITTVGPPSRQVNISAVDVEDSPGSVIDLRGGGDLYAYRWIPGNGGTIDVTASASSFAIIPSYQFDYAPYAPFNKTPLTTFLGSDPGYVNTNLQVGDQIFLQGGAGLAAGVYTLLPARYALLPGAFLVTPSTQTPAGTVAVPDGSMLVDGYRLDGLTNSQITPPPFSTFEIASAGVVRSRAEYADFLGNTFFTNIAEQTGTTLGRLPTDSGQLTLAATQAMSLQGSLLSASLSGGRGGLVDISSPLDILVAAPGATGTPDELVLDASALSAFGAESLLIGGIRQTTSTGTSVTVTTDNITVDNAGAPLTGPDVILVANKSLTLADGSDIEQSGALSSSADSLLIGSANTPGSGDGVLLRVSADQSAKLTRFGVDSSTVPSEMIGANAQISGASVTLDSTYATSLDPSAVLSGLALNLDSGQISIQLANGATPQNTAGLVLAGVALQNAQSADALSLLSYSSIDIYGTGEITASNSLGLHAAEIRGFNTGGTVDFIANSVTLDNSPGGTAPGAIAAQNGSLQFDASTVLFGANALGVNQFVDTTVNSSSGILLQGTGSFSTQGDLTISAPIITATKEATQTISATGAIALQPSATMPAQLPSSGLGSELTFVGASINDNTDIVLPSGIITLRATSGDLTIGDIASTTIDVGGTAQTFYDLVKYTSGGQVHLTADQGSVNIDANATVNVGAQNGGGDAGTLSIAAPGGGFVLAGTLNGAGGVGDTNGSFSLDIGTLPTLDALDTALDAGMFTESRSIRVRNGDVLVDGTATSHTFDLSADNGSITVTGTVDASGLTGGTINLDASGSVVLHSGSLLTVAGQNFDDAGKGGAISLEAGSDVNGAIDSSALLDIQTGSTIDLSVATQDTTSASLGDLSGKLHVRAPQLASGSDLQMNPIDGSIIGASAIVIEGYKLFDLTGTAGTIDSTIQSSVNANAAAFIGATGITTPTYTAMFDRLLANNQSLAPITVIEAGAEIINRNGDLTLGAANLGASGDWNLSTYRFGPNGAPGALTLRATGNLVFFNALTDGFTSGAFTAPLMDQNPLLPTNVQSWSYQLTAGADLGAAASGTVRPLDQLVTSSGSILLGKNGGANLASAQGTSALTATAVNPNNGLSLFQVIRTGTGDIDVAAGRDIVFLNQFSTIYTAGVPVLTPNSLFSADDFVTPIVQPPLLHPSQGLLGVAQQVFLPQYTLAGGNVSLFAGADMLRQTATPAGDVIADSSRQLPMNWLYRRGYVDPVTGQFGVGGVGSGLTDVTDPAASTTWWIDFSNFFEGVGALGGGNVSMIAGHDIDNIDAAVPTNARMPAGVPDTSKLVELGGGDLLVRAGNDVNGGVYYVERGQGTILAGNSITTNSTRSPSLTYLSSFTTPQVESPEAWLPTTLFAGNSTFDVSARGDVLLGPVANPFLLPIGLNNMFWNKSYFTTYSSNSGVDVSSLAGSVTFRTAATVSDAAGPTPILELWMMKELLFASQGANSAAYYQPWLRLGETNVGPFATVSQIEPPTLQAEAFSGDINLAGNLTLFPAASGTLDLVARGAINGLQLTGFSDRAVVGQHTGVWQSSQINVSDANPAAVPGVTSPFAYINVAGRTTSLANTTQVSPNFLSFINVQFQESGSTTGKFGVLQAKQALHASGPLHRNDPNPVHLYAANGDVADLTLFSPKATRVIGERDVADVSLYLQNVSTSDISLVASGRDILPFDSATPLLTAAQSLGNALAAGNGPRAGDIQISGPGTLEVLAGRNLDLGTGPTNADGTGAGITSIGNGRNPGLPFQGADLVIGAGIGISGALSNSELDFATFISNYLDPLNSTGQSARYLPELGALLGLTNASDTDIWLAFNQLSSEKQDALALDIFYLVLRDSGRDRNDPSSPNFGNFDEGFAAINTLFPGNLWNGEINTEARDVRTKNGGNISLFAPGGGLTMASTIAGNPFAPPGIITETGGNISIFTKQSVDVGIARIFTLRGGNEIIWSSDGDIAAGSASKTVLAAPPTRVVIDPQSGDVQTDLAGLATGGGIGVLESVVGIPPADVDLIAPNGTINAGEAGIRVSGNLNLAAVQIINASNITVGGTSVGVPTVAAPNIGSLTAASNTVAASSNAAQQLAQNNTAPPPQEQVPSIISVEVLGYGGGSEEDQEQQRRKKDQRQEQRQASADPQRLEAINTRNRNALPKG